MSLRRLARRIHEITTSRTYNPTPPTTAEIFVGITSGPMEPHEFLAYLVRLEFSALADDLCYYADKTTGGTAANGYLDAAQKIREVIDGTYLRDVS